MDKEKSSIIIDEQELIDFNDHPKTKFKDIVKLCKEAKVW